MKILLKSLLISVVLSSVSAHAAPPIYHDGDTTYVDGEKGSTTYTEFSVVMAATPTRLVTGPLGKIKTDQQFHITNLSA